MSTVPAQGGRTAQRTAAPVAPTRPPFRVLRLAETVSLRIRVRSVAVCAVLLAVLTGVSLLTLCTGDYQVPLPGVLRALFGGGDQATVYVVEFLRLPRLVTGVLVGAALGASGAVFQTLTRNPLGSPDVIGFGAGAATGALAAIALLHGDAMTVSAGAVAGGLATAGAVYALAFRRGSLQGYRLILVGIGVTGMLTAFNQWILTRASLNDAVTSQIWLTGSLGHSSWQQAVPLAGALAVLLPLTVSLSRRTDLLEMGDEVARSLGLRPERTRLLLIVLAVGLVAVGTAAAGPVTFIALAAPQVARRLTAAPGAGVAPAAVTGALLVPVSDLAAQRLPPAELPVGVATAAVGGVYLAFLLARQLRAGR